MTEHKFRQHKMSYCALKNTGILFNLLLREENSNPFLNKNIFQVTFTFKSHYTNTAAQAYFLGAFSYSANYMDFGKPEF